MCVILAAVNGKKPLPVRTAAFGWSNQPLTHKSYMYGWI
ncbi:hypothetical protein KNP414_04981 [Paenibacillus mucilaginosus KNP414]|uniref:Uncharacterized protein n=1 Tax=Paenibacillus mucilaginosus (strain KNP414) TaxID=1036673 RepID=F8FLD8_PAEMK|nr:hypothetical protein KNP414_04981 [Paenibacillus mucilaginosus KNP414]